MRTLSLLTVLFLLPAIAGFAAEGGKPHAAEVAAYDAILAQVAPGQTTLALGDMLVPVATVRLWRDQLAGTVAPSFASQTGINKWTGGTVYYAFTTSGGGAVSAAHQTATTDAMAEWATFANLHFIPRTAETNYVEISDGGAGLSGGIAAVGMVGGAQSLMVGASSWNRGTILHELGHVLGLIHEHQRSDRDTYVAINFSNVPGGLTDGNFIIANPASINSGTYDFLSVMHYPRKQSAVNPALDTITPKTGYTQFGDIMGNNLDRLLSRKDRDGMATMQMYGAGPAISTVVTNTNDSGPGSLRTALYKAFDLVTDTPAATPVITFNIPGGGPFTIQPTDRLPAPGPNTTIDASAQTIVLNGALQPPLNPYGIGLRLSAANVTVKKLIINGCANNGIFITGGSTNTRVVGCFIGTNAAGTAAVPNTFAGIEITGGATGNIIGGTTAADRNVISGNTTQGVLVRGGATGNSITGNYIGLNAAGTAALPNVLSGIEIGGAAQGNVVGGTTAGARNVISGNTIQGIYLNAAGTTSNVVSGNYIGTKPDGTGAIANGAAGVEISNAATGNTIGGVAAGAGNLLSGNGTQGVKIAGAGTTGNVVAGNFIGLNATGTGAVPNTFSGVGFFGAATGNTIGGTAAGALNIISGNTLQGIYITDAGTNANTVVGNWIGLNGAGTAALANKKGIEVGFGTQSNVIGGNILGARNVISGNTEQGVFLYSTTNNRVSGNYIGTNAAGNAAVGNLYAGVEIQPGATTNTIGGTAPGSGNVISGNAGRNVLIDFAGANNNTVAGNFIGLNAAGTAALVNGGPGIQIWGGAQSNIIGGTSGGRNFICGNNGEGLTISDSGTNANVVVGNSFGITPAGTIVGNTGNGISIFGGPQNNVVGGSTPGAANLLSGNGGSGISLYDTTTTGTRISGNAIYANGSLGIDLGGFGATANDANDTDAGPNNLQNFPVLTSATVGVGTTIMGTLNSNTSASGITYRIEFFANPPGPPTGNDEGQTFFGAIDVTTNASGAGSINSVLPAVVPANYFITATARDPAGNTSEFSAPRQVSFPDSDGDGLPDTYETAITNSPTALNAALDDDGDGFTNAQEFRAGTDPRNANNVLRLGPPVTVGNDRTLTLPSLAGRTYRIDYAEDLFSANHWRILADQISGTGSTINVTDPGTTALLQRFYRAVVVP